jgi:hypothetical protein
MMIKYGLISADSHVCLDKDAFFRHILIFSGIALQALTRWSSAHSVYCHRHSWMSQ